MDLINTSRMLRGQRWWSPQVQVLALILILVINVNPSTGKSSRLLNHHQLSTKDTPITTPTPTNSSNIGGFVKGGRCPEAKMDQRLCPQREEGEGAHDQCTRDEQCSGESRCCSTGCARVCVLPVYTACEAVRSSGERRARSLSPEDALDVSLPECDPATGGFKQVQCSPGQGCYCVDSQGFELPGTRTKEREQVNCSKRNPKCEGPTCRMLCQHGFALDSDGCEICECRNVCSGVKCPGGTSCEVEQVPCSGPSCPPTPSCKEPRSLDSLCPFGAPLTIPDSSSPFLCGPAPSGPSCPAAFQCSIGAGNDYGVCCAANRNFDKPGSCPVVGGTKESGPGDSCPTAGCRHDLECPDFDKCCFTPGCGKQCSKPANSSACLQQRHIAELLSGKELAAGKGYIPQCDEEGNFIPKQCSRNGKVCWCVGKEGKNFAQSLGPADSVNCTTITSTRQRAALRSDDSSYPLTCDPVICPPTISCEFGFQSDRNGCPSCDCNESPCAHLQCPSGSGCVLVPGTSGSGAVLEPTCLSDSLFVNPCPLDGSPLTHDSSAKVVTCSASAPTCPSSHICVLVAPNKAGLCCPNSPRLLEPTKPGMCPFLSASFCSSTSTPNGNGNNSLTSVTLDQEGGSHKRCGSDSECEHSMKCCGAGDCTVCADPLLQEDIEKSHPSPTMCQYLRDVDSHVDKELLGRFKIALRARPTCKENGEFTEIQCDSSHCTCVDEHGAEIPGTRMDKGTGHNLTIEGCQKERHNPKCLEMNCRLSCDYGYETLDGCKICECRNPCLSDSKGGPCGEDEICEMVDLDCADHHCPPLPFCVPRALAALAAVAESNLLPSATLTPCPKGSSPFIDPESNSTLSCSPRARMLQCPDAYFCSELPSLGGLDAGVCCPLTMEEDESWALHLPPFLVAQDRGGPAGDNVLDGHTHSGAKPGQCPYLIPFQSVGGGCSSNCQIDSHCPGGDKCCLNSCGGTQCAPPLLLTACQHQKNILEHKAREKGLRLGGLFIPGCDGNGDYLRVQYHGGFNWCVDSAGEEIQGTRVPLPGSPNCQKPSLCPQTHCSLQCEFGLSLDVRGCPLCECRGSPCDQVEFACSSPSEECRMIQLNCISEPCPPVPLCLPRLDNPCPAPGAPLRFEETGERVSCGGGSNGCPSSHKCNISPFGEYAVCCPKPKQACFEPRRENGPGLNCPHRVRPTATKWFFNSTANECQPFVTSGCGEGGGSENEFNSKAECLSVCPALTHCERIREKNSELVQKYGHMSYIPKCDPRSGDWEVIQSLEEVGISWCVDRKKGEPVKGTMTNGVPNCAPTPRRGRMIPDVASAVELNNLSVCEDGVTVHKCSKSTCENKICLGHPEALCLVNPCGGCNPKWVSPEGGKPINCSAGLGTCHRDMQNVMNSAAWINQGYSMASSGSSLPDLFQSEVMEALEQEEEEEEEEMMDLGPFGSLSQLLLRAGAGPPRNGNSEAGFRTMRKMGPIFASLGNGVMGVMSGSVTYVRGGEAQGQSQGRDLSSEESSSSSGSRESSRPRTPHSTPVKSIADILSDLMTSGAQGGAESNHAHHPSASGYFSDDGLLDLMPSSSSSIRMGRLLPHFRVRRGSGPAESYEDSLAVESSSHSVILPFPSSNNGHRSEILVSILPSRGGSHSTHSSEEEESSHHHPTCPPPSPFALLSLLSGACADECAIGQGQGSSGGCPPGLSCCLSGCGMRCIRLGDNSQSSSAQSDPSSRTIINPVYEAEDEPEFSNVSPTMVVSLPDCDSETGGYNPTQSQGELSWCVTPDGKPTPGSLTRGRVTCSSNGTLIQRSHLKGPVCPPHSLNPDGEVCHETCLTASCPSHPTAVCVMDVCGGCAPSFFAPSGERVRCEQKCQQPAGDPGLCRASILRHTFNVTSGRCESFIWGGCGGNDNNFQSAEDCAQECESGSGSSSLTRSGGGGSASDICSLPPKPGPCRASMSRWYFNPVTQSCLQFDYGGCGGLPNNFMTKEQCETRCPDVVLCPKMSMTMTSTSMTPEGAVEGGTGSLKTCSRKEACAKAMESCGGYSVDDFLCRVDPCTCSAILEDFSGHPVNCSDSSHSTIQSPSGDATILEVPPPAPSFFQGQILKLLPGIPLPTHSRCQLMVAQSGGDSDLTCDPVTGKFHPRQCPPSPNEACFCVDDSGRRVEEEEGGEGHVLSCETTPISEVQVSLSLPGGEDVSAVQLGMEMKEMLTRLGAGLGDGDVRVEILPGSTVLKFTLTGDNAVDVSYWLESLLIASAIGVEDPKGQFHPASFSSSSFTHLRKKVVEKVEGKADEVPPSPPPSLWEEDVALNEIGVDDLMEKIGAERHLLESGDQGVGVLLTLVAAISAVLLVLGLFLAGQKKKAFLAEGGGGGGHKKPFGGIGAFSSGLYEVSEKKKKSKKLAWREAVTIPTFRISPFISSPAPTPASGDEGTGHKT